MAQYSGMWTLSQASQAIKDNNWVNLPPQNVEFLVVAGGGGGGGVTNAAALMGGGGAGGLLASTTSLTAGVNYTITVGAGGAGQYAHHSDDAVLCDVCIRVAGV